MKKSVASFLAICLIFALCSCENLSSTTVIDESFSDKEIPDLKCGSEYFKTTAHG